LLVSHDRYFMDHLVEQLFVFEGDGKITVFNGNYSDYRSREDNKEEEEEEPVAKKIVENKVTPPSKKKEKKEYDEVQKDIERLEQERKIATEKLNDASLSHQQLTELGKRIGELTQQLDAKTNRWMELDEIINS
jgi:ATP-binding cassette subfamily F protein uup